MKNKYINYYLNLFKDNEQIKHKVLSKNKENYFFLLYNSNMIDKKELNETIIKELLYIIDNNLSLKESSLLNIEELNLFDYKEIEYSIYTGSLIIYSFNEKTLYSINIANFISRVPSLDSQEIVYSGSKDNLIESIDTNLT